MRSAVMSAATPAPRLCPQTTTRLVQTCPRVRRLRNVCPKALVYRVEAEAEAATAAAAAAAAEEEEV